MRLNLVLLSCVAFVALATVEASHEVQTHKPEGGGGDRQTRATPKRAFKLEWVGKPEVERGFGKTKLLTSCINTGNKPTPIVIRTNFSHTFEIEEGLGLDSDELGDLLEFARKELSVALTPRSGYKSLTNISVVLEHNSKGVVQFRENVIRLRGKVRKVRVQSGELAALIGRPSCSPDDAANCLSKSKPAEFVVSIRATELELDGSAKGVASIAYFGTDKNLHPEFYSLYKRHVDVTDAIEIDTASDGLGIKSPFYCAEQAISAGKSVALYDIVHMRCYLKEVNATNGSFLDRDNQLLGAYSLEGGEDPAASGSDAAGQRGDAAQAEQWAETRRCDIVHLLADRKTHVCKKWEKRDDFVLMFRKTAPRNN